MHKLLLFIRSTYVVVLFVIFQAVAISYYARSTHYTQARLLARSNYLVGGVHGVFADVKHYFSLGRENHALMEHVAKLKEKLSIYEEADMKARLDSYVSDIGVSKYRVMAASVISNTINRKHNMIVLDRGRKEGVVEQMSVLTSDGSMVGYIVDCTERYSIAMSVLNTSFRASGKLAGSDYFGSIYWDGVDPDIVIMDELSKYAAPQIGQEVLTTGFSQYFPPDVLIGTIESTELNQTQTSYMLRVRLSAEMGALSEVILVENRDLSEIRDLENSDKIEQYIR